ncbi:MAG: DUF3846 domain-containing protein [Blautia massiliensis (ex Durand et al. 2017)]|nr:MAG: hypothetical protein DBX91_13620 [Subdoligranulum variabile]
MESKKETMTVLVVEPGKYPYRKEIPSTLKAMQSVVGGLIEIVYPWPDSRAVVVCNDEGLINKLPLNRYLPTINSAIYGTFFICDGADDDLHALCDEDLAKYEQLFHSPEFFWMQNGRLFIYRCRPEEYTSLMSKQE